MAREEILAGPLEVYVAGRGESFPDVGADPTGEWELVGESGDENYTDDGVSVELPQDIEEFVGAGSTMAIKAFRTEESVEVTVNVADQRIAVLALALNDNAETESTGQREVALLRGGEVHEHALLLRGKSPYEDGDGQFQIPACYVSSEPEIEYVKGEPASVELTFRALAPTSGEEDDFAVIFSDASVT